MCQEAKRPTNTNTSAAAVVATMSLVNGPVSVSVRTRTTASAATSSPRALATSLVLGVSVTGMRVMFLPPIIECRMHVVSNSAPSFDVCRGFAVGEMPHGHGET